MFERAAFDARAVLIGLAVRQYYVPGWVLTNRDLIKIAPALSASEAGDLRFALSRYFICAPAINLFGLVFICITDTKLAEWDLVLARGRELLEEDRVTARMVREIFE